jgi:conjugative transposon TraK protein
MFTKMKTIDGAWRAARRMMWGMMLVCGLVSACAVFLSYRQVSRLQGKVYVMVNGQLVAAVAQDRDYTVELRHHVAMFHEYFFRLSPDEKVISDQVGRALYLADGSARREYQNLKEAGYYGNLISGNVSTDVVIDSVRVELDRRPFHFVCYGRQIITRTTSITHRSLITEGDVRTGLVQSDHNPHGFLIERWRVVENKDVKTVAR